MIHKLNTQVTENSESGKSIFSKFIVISIAVAAVFAAAGCGDAANPSAPPKTASQPIIPATSASNPILSGPEFIPSAFASAWPYSEPAPTPASAPASEPATAPATSSAANQLEIWKLAALLDDDDLEIRFKAVRRLIEIGEPALPVLEAVIKNRKPLPEANTDDEDEELFAAAARSTTQPKAKLEEIQKLAAKLADNDVKVREEATESLKKIGRPVMMILKELAENDDTDPEMAERAKAIIEHISNQAAARSYCVVYVVDCSGSMAFTFDYFRKEMLTSLGQLKESQDFHIIYFTKGTPTENPPKQLIVANRANKVMSAEFLKNMVPEGQTDPVPAMERAFDVLKDVKDKGKLIYFITDGQFPEAKEALAKLLADRNPPGTDRVMICTFQYGEGKQKQSPFLKKLAAKNGGRFKYVDTEKE